MHFWVFFNFLETPQNFTNVLKVEISQKNQKSLISSKMSIAQNCFVYFIKNLKSADAFSSSGYS